MTGLPSQGGCRLESGPGPGRTGRREGGAEEGPGAAGGAGSRERHTGRGRRGPRSPQSASSPGAVPEEERRYGSPAQSLLSGARRPRGKTNLPGELRSGVRRGALEQVFSRGFGELLGVADGGCGGPKVVLARRASQPTRAASWEQRTGPGRAVPRRGCNRTLAFNRPSSTVL